jgi:hypothetical protein
MSALRAPVRPFVPLPGNGTSPRTIPLPPMAAEDWKYLLIVDQARVSRASPDWRRSI